MKREVKEYFDYQNALRYLEEGREEESGTESKKTIYEIMDESCFVFLTVGQTFKIALSHLVAYFTLMPRRNPKHKHSWKLIYREHTRIFLEEKVAEAEEVFRICEGCNKVMQKHNSSDGAYWSKLDEKRAKIVIDKVKSGYLTGGEDAR